MRLGRRVADLPATKAAMQAGDLDWTQARTMSKVLTPDNESAWLERARACRNRELEADVKAASPGDLPPDGPPAKGPSRQRLTVDLEAVDLETIRQALALVGVEMGATAGEMEPGAALAAICRRFVESVDGDHAPTGEPYRILVEYCPNCGRTEGVDAEVSDTVQGEASCDAEVVALNAPERGHVTHAIPPKRRRAVLARDRYRCVVPGCRCQLWVHVHHLTARVDGGNHDERNLITLGSMHHRLLHDGYLAIERRGDTLLVEHLDGRRTGTPIA